jgi:hypothetical protein
MLSGDAIVLSSAILGISGTVITALCKWRPKGTNGFMPIDRCDDRFKSLCKGIERIEETQKEIFKQIERLRR